MKVVADTSSLISLAVVDLIDMPFLEIRIPGQVEEELEKISKYDDREGKAAEKLLETDIDISRVKAAERYLDKDVDEGEAACFALCKERGIKTFLIDDIDAAYSLSPLASRESIKLRMSFAVVSELLKRGEIGKEGAKEKVKEMVEIRNWGGSALEYLAEKWFNKIE